MRKEYVNLSQWESIFGLAVIEFQPSQLLIGLRLDWLSHFLTQMRDYPQIHLSLIQFKNPLYPNLGMDSIGVSESVYAFFTELLLIVFMYVRSQFRTHVICDLYYLFCVDQKYLWSQMIAQDNTRVLWCKRHKHIIKP